MIIEETEVMAEGWVDDVEVDDDSDLFSDIYVEISTGYIYEVQLFDTFCLVRPASPNMYGAIRKLDHVQFSGEFAEFLGDLEEVRNILRGGTSSFEIL